MRSLLYDGILLFTFHYPVLKYLLYVIIHFKQKVNFMMVLHSHLCPTPK